MKPPAALAALAATATTLTLLVSAGPAQAVTRLCDSSRQTFSEINIRYAPSVDAGILTSLPETVPVAVEGRRGNWYAVTLNPHNPQVDPSWTGTYWVYADYVCFNTPD